ncbi:MAG: Rrf2 family transcriptional regulator [Sedimentisphaerales bacterium]|nr:Rrf2 family transcriptional regulator [Sedimentisphaerales bacterium]
MKLSTRTRYGIRAILELAQNYGNGPLQLRIIARDQGVSIKYLEQLMAMLKAAGIVRSVRGSKGGYILAKSPGQVKVSECFQCLEGSVITTECVEDESFCERTSDCIARQVWTEVQEAVMGVLQSMTLQNLVDRAKNDKAIHYHI